LRVLAVWVLLGLYYLVPWFNVGGYQAVLFDLPARKFHILGLTLWPQDFVYLSLLLIVAGLSLFFFTALAGRLWCGFHRTGGPPVVRFCLPTNGVDRDIPDDRALG